MHSVTKITPIQFIDDKYHIKKWKSCKAALSGYYTWLIINALRADTHMHIPMFMDETISGNQVWVPGLKGRGLKWINYYKEIHKYVANKLLYITHWL